jgi:hypothetical protein
LYPQEGFLEEGGGLLPRQLILELRDREREREREKE